MPKNARQLEELLLRSSWYTSGMSAFSQKRQINLCCYPGGVPDSPLVRGLLPTRSKPLLVSVWGASQLAKCNWSFLLKEAWYLGSLQRRTPGLLPQMGGTFSRGWPNTAGTWEESRVDPEGETSRPEVATSLGKYLVGVSGSSQQQQLQTGPAVVCGWANSAEPRRAFIPQHVPRQTAMMAPGVTLLHAAGDRALWDCAGWEVSGFSYLLAAPWEAERSQRCRAGAHISPALVLRRLHILKHLRCFILVQKVQGINRRNSESEAMHKNMI